MRYLLATAFVILTLGTAHSVHATSNWPASSGSVISGALMQTLPPSGQAFEPSDITLHNGSLIVVSDEGDVATMDVNGGNLAEWLTWRGNDMEGVTIVNEVMYVLNEWERDVYAYDVTSHVLLRTYDLSGWISGNDNLGPEALVYHNGQWLVGHSETEEVYAFDLTGNTPVFLGSWSSGAHVRAMHSGEDGKLYVMSSGRVVVFDGMTEVIDYTLPSGPSKPEGFALLADCALGTATAFIAYDSGSVYRYENFPVSCPVVLEPSPEPTPEPDPEPAPIVFSSVAGNTNGRITVTYSDGSTATYAVYDMRTTRLTSGYQYKDSRYLVVTGPYGGRIAVVDAYTGVTIAMRSTPTRASILSAWLLSVIGY